MTTISRIDGVPIVAVTGKKNSGKTTTIESLIRLMKHKGWKICTIKHHHHGDFEPDTPGKDSHRHFEAGATGVLLAAPNKLAYFEKIEGTIPPVESLVGIFPEDTTLILLEGFHKTDFSRIEISRNDISDVLLTEDTDLLIALITDNEFAIDVPIFGLKQIEAVADHLHDVLSNLS